MDDQILKYKIGITLIKGIGNSIAKNLIAYVGSAEGVFKEKKSNLKKIPGVGEYLSTEIENQNILSLAEKEIEFIKKNNIQALFYADKNYPYRLKECSDSPVMLYFKGSCNLNDGKFIAIVGTRNATETGKENCIKLVSDLSNLLPNVVVVSGLAYGIDITAHKTALDRGVSTLGVVGHGLDILYPATHRPVATKMINSGGIITEYISNTNPDRQNFVQRNRIIAGLCDAVIVIESKIKGGALLTAEFANEYNRDVFTFPGRVSDEFSGGCNALIKANKASLIENAQDLVSNMNWDVSMQKNTENVQAFLFHDLTDVEQKVIASLRQFSDGIHVNELAVSMNMPYSKVSSLLLEMEFKGIVKCLPGGIYRVLK